MHLYELFGWGKSTTPCVRFQIFQSGRDAYDVEIESFPALIGRSSGADLPLTDRLISRAHCSLTYRDGDFALRDLESRHGVFINGKQINEQVLQVDDEIFVGTTRLVVTELTTPIGASTRTHSLRFKKPR